MDRIPMMRLCLIRCATLFFPVCLFLSATIGIASARITVDADQQYQYAQSLLDREAFDEAVYEFNRFIHFFPDDAKVPRARFQTGMAHFGAGRFSKAAVIFDERTRAGRDSTLAVEAYFMLSRCHAEQAMVEQAMVDLHNLMAVTTQKQIIDRARYELAWLHVDRGRWKDANRIFSEISSDNQDRYGVHKMRTALEKSDRIPEKNPTVAGLLSVVPGAGQIYVGRYRDAFTAVIVNTGLILAAWEAFDNELYALGGTIGFVAFGFYAGNIYGSVSSAHKYNRDRQTAFRDDLYRLRSLTISLGPVPGGARFGLRAEF